MFAKRQVEGEIPLLNRIEGAVQIDEGLGRIDGEYSPLLLLLERLGQAFGLQIGVVVSSLAEPLPWNFPGELSILGMFNCERSGSIRQG